MTRAFKTIDNFTSQFARLHRWAFIIVCAVIAYAAILTLPAIAQQWEPAGPQNFGFTEGSGRINDVEIDPTDPDIIYVGASKGGVWKTINGGQTWTPLTDDLPCQTSGDIVIDPVKPSIIYWGTGEGHNDAEDGRGCGIFRSDDGGENWTKISPPDFDSLSVKKMAIDPGTGGTVATTTLWAVGRVVGVPGSRSGVVFTNDGGTNWSADGEGDVFHDFDFHPTDGSIYFFTFSDLGGPADNQDGIYRTASGSQTQVFQQTGLDMGRIEMAVSPVNPANVAAFVSLDGSTGIGIYKSTDGGATFNFNGAQLKCDDICPTNFAVEADRTSATTFWVGIDKLIKVNVATNPSGFEELLPADTRVRSISISKSNPQVVVVGTDTGVLKSINGGQDWTQINNNLQIAELRRGVSVAPTEIFRDFQRDLFAGSRDFGPVRQPEATRVVNPTNWQEHPLDGDNASACLQMGETQTLVRPVSGGGNEEILVAACARGVDFSKLTIAIRTPSGGTPAQERARPLTVKQVTLPSPVQSIEFPPIHIRENKDTAIGFDIYVGGSSLMRSRDGGDSWELLPITDGGSGVPIPADGITRLAKGPLDWVAFGLSNGFWGLHIPSINVAGVENRPRAEAFSDLVHVPGDPGGVILTYARKGGPNVYFFDGANGPDPIDGNLPDIEVYSAAVDANDPKQTFYIGTENGVYRTIDQALSWQAYNDGMPPVKVIDLEFDRNRKGVLHAVTEGRGVYRVVTDTYRLVATPGAPYLYSGNAGGNDGFSPPSKTYTLTNEGARTLDWTYAGTIADVGGVNQVIASPSSGTLIPGASVQVTLTPTLDFFRAITPGSSFTNIAIFEVDQTEGNIFDTVRVVGTSAVPELTVSPAQGYVMTGPQGGPFLPASKPYTLENSGDGSLRWRVSADKPWLDISIPQGTPLPAGQTQTVQISPNMSANALPAGQHTATLTFENLVTGQKLTRAARITATPEQSMVVLDDQDMVFDQEAGQNLDPGDIRTYEIRNNGKGPLRYRVSEDAGFLEFDDPMEAEGVVQAGQRKFIDFKPRANTSNLVSRRIIRTITFTNLDNGVGNTTRNVVLNVTSNDLIRNAYFTVGDGTEDWLDTSPLNNTFRTETGERVHYARSGISAPIKSAWFKWRVPNTGQAVVRTLSNAGFNTVSDPVMAVYVANKPNPTVADLTQIASDDNSGSGSESRIAFHATKDTVYYIAVAAKSTSTATGRYQVEGKLNTSASPANLVAAVLPYARSVANGSQATAFATIINSGSNNATRCGVQMPSQPTGQSMFSFQTVDAANELTGTANRTINIPAGQAQGFVFAITPGASLAGGDIPIVFDCENRAPVVSQNGLNTFILSSAGSQPPDMLAISATPAGNGIVDILGNTGVGFFAVSSVNIGTAGTVTVAPRKSIPALPVSMTICETNSSTGACLQPPSASVQVTAAANAIKTFTVFVTGSGNVPFDPAKNRLFVEFRQGTTIRGATTVAVRTGSAGGNAQVSQASSNTSPFR